MDDKLNLLGSGWRKPIRLLAGERGSVHDLLAGGRMRFNACWQVKIMLLAGGCGSWGCECKILDLLTGGRMS